MGRYVHTKPLLKKRQKRSGCESTSNVLIQKKKLHHCKGERREARKALWAQVGREDFTEQVGPKLDLKEAVTFVLKLGKENSTSRLWQHSFIHSSIQ